jgi:hypothetical protein
MLDLVGMFMAELQWDGLVMFKVLGMVLHSTYRHISKF